MKTALIYGAHLPAARETADYLKHHGWTVLCRQAGELTPSGQPLDLLVVAIDPSYDGADGPVGTDHDYEAMLDTVSRRVHEAFAAVDAFLPALEQGAMKRIVFLSSRRGSIRECGDQEGFVPHMILAGVHMQAKLLFNRLRKQGYTFRLFAADPLPGQTLSPGAYAAMDLSYDPKEPYIHSEENRFVLRDGLFREIGW